jgi:hypothetical protein
MRTNNKEFKVQIQDHIINSILSDECGDTLKEQLQAVIDGFNNWYSPYEKKRQSNIQEAFTDWAMCLPSEFNIEYRNFEIQELIKTWFNTAGETYKEPKDDQKTYDLYYWLVFRELNNLFKQNKLSLYSL